MSERKIVVSENIEKQQKKNKQKTTVKKPNQFFQDVLYAYAGAIWDNEKNEFYIPEGTKVIGQFGQWYKMMEAINKVAGTDYTVRDKKNLDKIAQWGNSIKENCNYKRPNYCGEKPLKTSKGHYIVVNDGRKIDGLSKYYEGYKEPEPLYSVAQWVIELPHTKTAKDLGSLADSEKIAEWLKKNRDKWGNSDNSDKKKYECSKEGCNTHYYDSDIGKRHLEYKKE